MKKKIFIITGEPSGDLHGASLLSELYKIIPSEHLLVKATGSNYLRDAGAEIYFDSKNLSSVGLTEVLRKLSLYVNLMNEILSEINIFNPDVIVLVDFPGFNIRLLKKIKKYSPKTKIIYYLPPQVWAWNQGRTKILAKYCDLVLCGLPFEEEFHRKRGVNAFYVGNPIVHELEKFDREKLREELNIKKDETLIGIFPGSRKSEIHSMLSVYIEAASKIINKFSHVKFIISEASNVGKIEGSKYWNIPENLKNKIKIFPAKDNGNYKLLCASDMLLLSSGTVTLEGALYETPLILGYRGNWINYFLFLLLKRVDMVGLPNIIVGKRIIPELLQMDCNPDKYLEIANNWLYSKSNLERVKNDLKEVRKILTDKNASKEAALKIYSLITS